MPSKRKLKFIDLFCGMGGFRLAFESCKCKCVFSSDIDKYARETYHLNFNEYPAGDIKNVQSSDIPDFDILCAGFPCQPFSIAGKRLGFEDTRGTLFFEVARIIKDKQPQAFILENVKGITNHDNGTTIKVINNTLKDLGYKTFSAVLNAKDFGIPQNRERWYCVGFKEDLVDNDFTFSFDTIKKTNIKLSDIIGHEEGEKYKASNICMKNIYKFVKLKNIVVDENTLAYEIRPSRCQFAVGVISPCLTAKMGTGGNNIPVVISQQRKLTEKECLKIMGYPDEFNVYGHNQAYKQIGNSVVVPVITNIAKKIVAVLKEN